jgi:hypothetical protein
MANKKTDPYPTNTELKSLMAEVPLSQREVAEYTDSSVEAVKGWCAAVPKDPEKKSRFRRMPPLKLRILKLELKGAGRLRG